jgi:hypothetical protein
MPLESTVRPYIRVYPYEKICANVCLYLILAIQYTHALHNVAHRPRGDWESREKIMSKEQHYQAAVKAFEAMLSAKTDKEMEEASVDFAYHMIRANAV